MFLSDETPGSSALNGNLKERAYRIIRDSIVTCRYTPGSLLSEKDLIREIGTSRTPIREALARLASENLIRIMPQRGCFVSEITLQTINDVYQVREMLEPGLVRMVAPMMEKNALSSFRSRFSALSAGINAEAIVLDGEFHSFILSFCKNEYIVSIMETMYAQNERIRILMARMPNRLESSTCEHLAIIDALLESDTDRATEAMRVHMVNSRQSAIHFHAGYHG